MQTNYLCILYICILQGDFVNHVFTDRPAYFYAFWHSFLSCFYYLDLNHTIWLDVSALLRMKIIIEKFISNRLVLLSICLFHCINLGASTELYKSIKTDTENFQKCQC